MICLPDRMSSDGIVTMKSGIVLKEAMAKKNDVIEYSEHPFIGEIVLAGDDCFGKVGEYLLLPSRLANRLDSLDHVIVGNTDYYILNDSLCSCKKTTVDRSKYKYMGEE
jgi:hypothetical protein